jgi:hypothetical protein
VHQWRPKCYNFSGLKKSVSAFLLGTFMCFLQGICMLCWHYNKKTIFYFLPEITYTTALQQLLTVTTVHHLEDNQSPFVSVSGLVLTIKSLQDCVSATPSFVGYSNRLSLRNLHKSLWIYHVYICTASAQMVWTEV